MPNNPTPIERALARLTEIEEMRKATGDPGKWEANLEDAEFGETITIEAEGSQIAHVLNVEEFCCLGEEDYEKCDAQSRATAVEIAALRNSAPSMAALIRAQAAYIAALEEAGKPLYSDHALTAALMMADPRRAALDAALLQFAEAGGDGGGR